MTFTITAAATNIGSEIVGDGQPGFWSSSYTTWTTGQGLDGTSQISVVPNGGKQSMAAWWFSMPAGLYDIAVTYSPGSNLTTKLGLDLYDGVGNWIGQVQVNEQAAPADFTDQGVGWKRLGSSTWNSPADGAICVDAIELRAVPMINDGDSGAIANSGKFTTAGAWTTAAQGAFGDSHTSSGAAGSGSSVATWTMPVTSGTYEVDATWTPSAGLSTSVTYNVYDGATKLGSVTVNQRNAPAGVTDEGVAWTSLGTFTIGTQVKVTVANVAGDGPISADAIRVKPSYQPTSSPRKTAEEMGQA